MHMLTMCCLCYSDRGLVASSKGLICALSNHASIALVMSSWHVWGLARVLPMSFCFKILTRCYTVSIQCFWSSCWIICYLHILLPHFLPNRLKTFISVLLYWSSPCILVNVKLFQEKYILVFHFQTHNIFFGQNLFQL